MTRVSAGSCAAMAADSPCGRASTTTSYPVSSCAPLGWTVISAKGSRWGCSSPRRRPALELACTPARRRFGCAASSRHTSPPAYPVAPVTPTVHVCPVLTMHDHTRACMDVHQDISPALLECGVDHPGMRARLHHLVLDCPDPRDLARFYAQLLDQPVTYDSADFVVVSADDRTSGL